jgi:hypothetical protein
MQNATSSSRSGYNDLLKVYRESSEEEEKARVLGVNHLDPHPLFFKTRTYKPDQHIPLF